MPKTKEKDPPKKPTAWKCPKCESEFNAVQMELQPKVCTSCGKSALKPLYA